jgi:hypothetical protein
MAGHGGWVEVSFCELRPFLSKSENVWRDLGVQLARTLRLMHPTSRHVKIRVYLIHHSTGQTIPGSEQNSAILAITKTRLNNSRIGRASPFDDRSRPYPPPVPLSPLTEVASSSASSSWSGRTGKRSGAGRIRRSSPRRRARGSIHVAGGTPLRPGTRRPGRADDAGGRQRGGRCRCCWRCPSSSSRSRALRTNVRLFVTRRRASLTKTPGHRTSQHPSGRQRGTFIQTRSAASLKAAPLVGGQWLLLLLFPRPATMLRVRRASQACRGRPY